MYILALFVVLTTDLLLSSQTSKTQHPVAYSRQRYRIMLKKLKDDGNLSLHPDTVDRYLNKVMLVSQKKAVKN